MREKLLRNAFFTLVLVAMLHFAAIELSLYWTMHYFDSAVHFFGGASVGFASLWFVVRNKPTLSVSQTFLIAFLGTLLMGIVWEIFELTGDITTFTDGIHYVTDTSLDVVMDLAGGLLAALYSRKYFKNPSQTT